MNENNKKPQNLKKIKKTKFNINFLYLNTLQTQKCIPKSNTKLKVDPSV